jgi:hypothetical protein
MPLAIAAIVIPVLALVALSARGIGGASDARHDAVDSRAADAPDPPGDFSFAAIPRDTLEGPSADKTPDRSALLAPDVPIDQRITLLVSAADAGDAWAACAGEAEITRCRKLHGRDGRWDDYPLDLVARSGLDDAQLPEASRQLSAQLERVRQLREACDRLPPEVEQSVMRLRLQAARAGDVESMALFAEAEGVQEDLIANPQVYHLYRQHAFAMFLGAFEAGDRYALRLWVDVARSDSKLPLAGLMPPQWRDHAVATELASRVDANTYRGLDPGDPDKERASRQADALYRRYFDTPRVRADASHAPDVSGPALATLTDIEQLTHFDILERNEGRCDRLR